jgi:D-alanine-D-alanine ligase
LKNALPGRVAIAHNAIVPADDPSIEDVLAQAALVADGLAELGIPSEVIAVPDGRAWEVVEPADGLAVFNLIESPPGAPHVTPAATAALEVMGLPFTGCSAAALWLTTDKLMTRVALAAAGLPVAPGGELDPRHPEVLDRVAPPWIVKPAREDASVGMETCPVCSDRAGAVARAEELKRRFPGQPVLVESYLPGREFNVSVLEEEGGKVVLPVAEMTFVDFPPEMPRVLCFDAKWAEGSFAYEHTERRFVDAPEDAALAERLRELTLAAWKVCGLAGYGRVDMRLDAAGRPRILEVNGNSCIAPDSGLIAAAEQAGLGVGALMKRIVAAAMRRHAARGNGNGSAQGGAVSISLSAARPVEASVERLAACARGNGNGGAPARCKAPLEGLAVRDGLEPEERPAIERLLRATGFFNGEELKVAMELVDARLAEGPGCHYRFLVAAVDGEVAGYTCWGPIEGTRESADLYWIAVDPRLQGRQVGAALLAAAEERMRAEGRVRVYVETSTRPQYESTRGFYCRNGYRVEAELADFYGPGDGKAIYLKVLAA